MDLPCTGRPEVWLISPKTSTTESVVFSCDRDVTLLSKDTVQNIELRGLAGLLWRHCPESIEISQGDGAMVG